MAVIYKNPHEQSCVIAREELAMLEVERGDLTERIAWIDTRMQQLEIYLKAVAPLIENDPGRIAAEGGLTNVCRDLLDRSHQWMSAGEMRLLLSSRGIDISAYTNPMAVLHSVLKRVGQEYRDNTGNLLYGSKDIPLPLESPEGSVGDLDVAAIAASSSARQSIIARLKKQS
jgi:hypothetical protein